MQKPASYAEAATGYCFVLCKLAGCCSCLQEVAGYRVCMRMHADCLLHVDACRLCRSSGLLLLHAQACNILLLHEEACRLCRSSGILLLPAQACRLLLLHAVTCKLVRSCRLMLLLAHACRLLLLHAEAGYAEAPGYWFCMRMYASWCCCVRKQQDMQK